jgi:hypothetical protein
VKRRKVLLLGVLIGSLFALVVAGIVIWQQEGFDSDSVRVGTSKNEGHGVLEPTR